MGKKEKSDELIVVDAERYHKVKKALEASQSGEPAPPPGFDEKESTRELVVVDVGRYKKVKRALAESEERYRHLFENVPIGIYRTTPDGRIVDANPALVAMLGYGSFAELATRNLEQDAFEPGYDRGSFIRLLEREGEIKGLEAGWKKKDGSLIQIRENAKLIRDEDGQVFFEGTVEDITRNKLAEEEQRIHTQQIEILNTLITKGNQAESITDMLEKILESVAEPLRFDTAGFYMYDPEAKQVGLKARWGLPSQFYLLDEYMAIDSMPFSQVLLHGQPVFVDHLRDVLPDFAEKWGWRMAGVIPLVSKERIIGALGLASCRRELFTSEEKNILELIGKEAGTLISKLQTETALRESEKYYRTLVETSPDIVFTLALNGTMTMVNQRFLKLSGFAFGDVVGHNVLELIGEMDPEYLRQGMQSLVQSNEIFLFEYPVRRKDGSPFPMEMALSVLTDAGGQPFGIMGVGRDISERRRAEEALRDSEERYRTLFNSAGDSIIIHDGQERILAANRLAAERLGYTLDELQALTISEIDAPGDRPHTRERIDTLLREGKLTFETFHQHKDGSPIPFEVSSRRIDWGGQPAMMSSCRDIRERRKAEADLRESEETFRRIFAGIPNPAYMWVDQGNGRVTLSQFNRAAEEITRGKIKEFLGVDVAQLYSDRPELAERTKATMRSGKPWSEEILYTFTSTGETKWLVVDYVCTSPGHVMVITRDVTERKEAEAKLLAYQEQLRALTSELTLVEERERRRLAADLHDQIGQNLALCKLKVVALEKDKITERARSELSAVRRLLECSIQDARSLIFDLSPPILYELGFEAALEWLAEWVGEQYHVPVDFESHAAGGSLEIDRQVILFQVVRELLVNMGKHSQAGRAKVFLSLEGDSLQIQVNDDGRGFDASRVFDSRKPKSGYGFFSMRERLKYLGGSIDVRSKPGMGTQVTLTVPRESPAPEKGGKEGP